MITAQFVAGVLYDRYAESVNGIFPYHSWEELQVDETTARQANAWIAVAEAAIRLLS